MISATVLTKNCEKTLAETLSSLAAFPEVILLDSGSEDATLEIAARYPNVSLHKSTFLGFGPMHNYASKLATHDWILSIDSDEVISDDLASELLSIQLDEQCVYTLYRHNYFNGRHMKWCAGWHPDPVVRLYNRKTTRFSNDLVHEKVLSDGLKTIPLKSPLLHTPYLEMSDFLDKMQRYSTLFAEQRQGEKSSLTRALLHGTGAFWKSYLFKRGFLGGKEGFIVSLYNGHTAYYKYLKLAEK